VIRHLAAALLAMVLLLPQSAAGAAKTDVLVMSNGDYVTCEIKVLEYGMLTVKTDDMGTLQIKWQHIARLTSQNLFLVKTNSGFLHYGRFEDSGGDRLLKVVGPMRTADLHMSDLATIERIKKDFWDKFDLAAGLGYQYTKSTSITVLRADASIDYRSRIRRAGGKITADITENESDIKRRYDGTGYYSRTISGRLQAQGSLGARRHDELGLQLRLRGGGGLGYDLLDKRISSLTVGAGIYLTREWAVDGGIGEDSWEGMFNGSFKVFDLETPKTDITLNVAAMPNLTISGRVRSDIDLKARREMVKDLFLVLTWYESRDNQPPEGAEATSDRGVVFSVEWSK